MTILKAERRWIEHITTRRVEKQQHENNGKKRKFRDALEFASMMKSGK